MAYRSWVDGAGWVLALHGLPGIHPERRSRRRARASGARGARAWRETLEQPRRRRQALALYPALVYSYTTDDKSTEPNDSTKLDYTFHPIISSEHPKSKETLAILEQALEDQNPDFKLDAQFAMIVKSKQFATLGSLPLEPAEVASAQGMVVNDVSSLDAEEERLLRESFPTLDMSRVLILEEGRKPAGILLLLAYGLGGLVLLVGAPVGWGAWTMFGRARSTA